MRARLLGVLICELILLLPRGLPAQEQGKIPLIGILSPSPVPASDLAAFREGLRELGYIEGKNIILEQRSARGRQERLPKLAADLVHLKVDIIVAVSTPAAQAAKQATSTIPVVMARSGDALRVGLVRSLARPGGNITGLSFLGPELMAKRLGLLKEVVPRIAHVAVIWNSTNPHEKLLSEALQTAAPVWRVKLQSVEVQRPSDYKGAFAKLMRIQSDALIVFENRMNVTYRKLITGFAAKSRLPAMYGEREFVDVGGLISYGPSSPDLFRRVAVYVDKILKGTKPADLPVEQPTKFELVINLRAAKQIGVKIPAHILIEADKVIE